MHHESEKSEPLQQTLMDDDVQDLLQDLESVKIPKNRRRFEETIDSFADQLIVRAKDPGGVRDLLARTLRALHDQEDIISERFNFTPITGFKFGCLLGAFFKRPEIYNTK